MKDKNSHTVRTIPKSNIKIIEGDKIDTTNTHMTAHFPGLRQELQQKVAGLN